MTDIITIGTCVRGGQLADDLQLIRGLGFETVQLYFPGSLNGFDLTEVSRIQEALAEGGVRADSLGLYGNPLESQAFREELEYCLKHMAALGLTTLGTFAGALGGQPVQAALPLFKEHFSRFAKIAEDNGVDIAIENYPDYGHFYRATSNIGFCPRSWELMFNEVDSPNLGLEWEPAHQIEQFIDPLPQLEAWVSKVRHVHGKDARIDREALASKGILSCEDISQHKFPGLGETDWTRVFTILRQAGYQGSLTVEGFHDPEYAGAREAEGQALALRYLKACRDKA
jgi:sugar phosphate isomerase/epimerase